MAFAQNLGAAGTVLLERFGDNAEIDPVDELHAVVVGALSLARA